MATNRLNAYSECFTTFIYINLNYQFCLNYFSQVPILCQMEGKPVRNRHPMDFQSPLHHYRWQERWASPYGNGRSWHNVVVSSSATIPNHQSPFSWPI